MALFATLGIIFRNIIRVISY